jgi:endonuclease/exonuclease/phosphatase family metal-dependent hydrolase
MGCSPIASRYRKTHQEALRYLLDELRADIALVQEALLAPATLASPGYLFKSPSLVGHDAGSAVLASGIAARELSLRADGCCIAAAELERPSGTFVAVSVHVSTLRTQKRFLRSLIDSLMPVLAGKRFVVGGDFNAAREYSESAYGWFFDDLASRGFHDCHRAIHWREVTSFWGHQAPKAGIQDDHLFIDAASASQVLSCEVVDNNEVRRLSDHGPLLLVIDP